MSRTLTYTHHSTVFKLLKACSDIAKQGIHFKWGKLDKLLILRFLDCKQWHCLLFNALRYSDANYPAGITLVCTSLKQALGYANFIVPGSISYYLIPESLRKNHLDNAGIKPGTPAQQANAQSISPIASRAASDSSIFVSCSIQMCK